MAELKNWSNANRFLESRFECPQCGEGALEDAWPPNYWGGNSSFGPEDEGGESENFTMSGMKHICEKCKISFEVHYYEKTRYEVKGHLSGWKPIETKMDYAKIAPLEERDGFLLTPHDVWQEEYKEKHGEYKTEVYC